MGSGWEQHKSFLRILVCIYTFGFAREWLVWMNAKYFFKRILFA